jgi:hypothetical protein
MRLKLKKIETILNKIKTSGATMLILGPISGAVGLSDFGE